MSDEVKKLLAATSGALACFWGAVVAGVLWQRVNAFLRIRCFSPADLLFIPWETGIGETASKHFSPAEFVTDVALLGGLGVAFYVALPAAVIGAVAGLLAETIPARRRANFALAQRRAFGELFADSGFFLAAVLFATAVACATGFVSFVLFFPGWGD